ncbi:hypothetical protein PVOR_14224 [Paenibacillus vortex V453]|uniref:AraC-type arabinose-binding/dimerisation domain-containing protein n=1 Tax=Paenibacillus vortex V453 TaxID=715225 RepID=A0A2R9SVW0_9BACL|nr:AraC family ligand binding domain-containing protein [Paenibacillus vortex]EFU41518.1 hypothetical protein PVOR_14224 [Paenibacillus vortex V453]
MKNENGRINRSTWFYVLKDIQLRSEYIDWREDFVQGNEFTLLIVTAGSGKWVLDKTELTMRGGQSYLIAPGSTARLRSETEGMCFYHLTYELWRSEGR